MAIDRWWWWWWHKEPVGDGPNCVFLYNGVGQWNGIWELLLLLLGSGFLRVGVHSMLDTDHPLTRPQLIATTPLIKLMCAYSLDDTLTDPMGHCHAREGIIILNSHCPPAPGASFISSVLCTSSALGLELGFFHAWLPLDLDLDLTPSGQRSLGFARETYSRIFFLDIYNGIRHVGSIGSILTWRQGTNI